MLARVDAKAKQHGESRLGCVALAVPATRIHEIVKERRGITADTAERLAHHFGGDAASWMSLQADYDLKTLPTRAEIERRVHRRNEQADA